MTFGGRTCRILQSVASTGDEESPKYHSELTLSEQEFKNIAEEKIDGVDWNNGLVSNINRSNAGGIVTIDVGGVNIKGTEFRNIFSLRSANVEISQENGNIKMSVKGFGHGVGMSSMVQITLRGRERHMRKF